MSTKKVPLPTEKELSDLNQWQPIETAPKDGTLYLALSTKVDTEYIGVMRMSYVNGYPCAEVMGCCFPTHWMPLPAAPERK